MDKKIKAYIFDELGQAKTYELSSVHDMLKMDYILSKRKQNVTFLYENKWLYINDDLDFIDNEENIKKYIDKIDNKEKTISKERI